ncbi:leucine--tRNA ligase-like [Sycon ciliatum]|uniref:leucine--tRNA ligase-like n=1 Tax=Sycon ciliatum TaxID=27933 RepID=UPI0031F692A3
MVWALLSSTLRRCTIVEPRLLQFAKCSTQPARRDRDGEIDLDSRYSAFVHTLEDKWQKQWKEDELTKKDVKPYSSSGKKKKKNYVLSMFPYPSGRLHLGHVRVYTLSHTLAAYRRMQGYDVIHPMGWDSFGLPAENAAIDRDIAPHTWTESNIKVMREQLESVGLHFDWQREIATHRPEYYKWTQWLFLKLYEHKLAYQSSAFVNWDPVDQTVLANEQVDGDGRAWRSGAKAERRELRQWFIRISEYSQELYGGLASLDWPGPAKKLQKSWISPSRGTVFKFKLTEKLGSHEDVEIYTTLPRDVFGVSFISLSRSHPLVHADIDLLPAEHREKVRDFGMAIFKDRTEGDLKGVYTGLTVVHPFTGKHLPVYTAGYVHEGYGTGAVMAVPGRNDMDKMFAAEHNIPIEIGVQEEKLINAGQFNGMDADSKDTDTAIAKYGEEQGFAYAARFTRLRDWLVSRQRYWGTPIPIIHCSSCPQPVPIPEDQLPVILPADVKLQGRGGSPLAKLDDWVNVPCPKCGSPAKRDTDTMDTFVDSAWYFLRFADPSNQKELVMSEDAMPEGAQSYLPVDTYIGGIEHAILHLLYARFIHRFVHNLGIVKSKEPFKHLITQGLVQGKTYRSADDGRHLKPEEIEIDGDVAIEKATGKQATMEWDKMSKSKHNGIDPMDLISRFGADTIRLYILGDSPSANSFKWQEGGLIGYHRMLSRQWVLLKDYRDSRRQALASGLRVDEDNLPAEHLAILSELEIRAMESIAKCSNAFEAQSFQTVVQQIARLHDRLNPAVQNPGVVTSDVVHRGMQCVMIMLWPLAPHMAEELWQGLEDIHGVEKPSRVWQQSWPKPDEFQKYALDEWTVRIVGSSELLRFQMPAKYSSDLDAVQKRALSDEVIRTRLAGRKVQSANIRKCFLTLEVE